MVKAAVDAAKKQAKILKVKPPLLIGVTVLTSKIACPEEILSLAQAGLAWGLDGVVCSAQEAKKLRKKIKKDFVMVTPGIRANGALKDDQKRTATVCEAVSSGSSFLVIGRPILKAADPLAAANEMLGDLHGRRN